MNQPEHYFDIGKELKYALGAISHYTGFPSDDPFCFAKKLSDDPVIRAQVANELKDRLKRELEENENEVNHNPKDADRFKRLMELLIECMES